MSDPQHPPTEPVPPGWQHRDRPRGGPGPAGEVPPRGPAVPPVPAGHVPAGASPPGLGGQPRHSATGAGAWWAGLTVLFLFPFLSSIAAGVVQWLIGRGQVKNGPVATANGRRAANWGMTYLISTVLLVGGHFLLLWILTRDADASTLGFYPLGILLTVWGVHTLAHIVVSIWGGVVAGAGKVFWANGIPFLR